MMEIFGYAGAFLVGLTLGIIGGGGSILTVPILVYLFSIDTVLATAYSLFIVGITSLIGSYSHMKMGNVQWRITLFFGLPSVTSVFLTRLFLVPAIPNPVFYFGERAISKSMSILLLFAVVMLLAAYSMIRKSAKAQPEAAAANNTIYLPILSLAGAMEGMLTGLVGAGGGFLIIPALVLLAKIPIKQAIGSSLVIIATKSIIGFLGDIKGNPSMDWIFLLFYSGLAIIGIITGSFLSKHIPGEKLKPAFGWFVLVMGFYIIGKEWFS